MPKPRYSVHHDRHWGGWVVRDRRPPGMTLSPDHAGVVIAKYEDRFPTSARAAMRYARKLNAEEGGKR